MTNDIEESFAGLPLHKKENPWINVVYIDGTKSQVDLRTLFLEAHKIKEASLDLPYSTAILHKIFVTIAYKLLDVEESESDWNEYREELIFGNEGFAPEKVEKYFEEFEDRFYLLHSYYPFMQDPYLKKSISSFKQLSKVSTIEPGKVAVEKEDSFEWGLPDTKDVKISDPHATRKLMSAMLYQLYGYSTVHKSVRQWADYSEKEKFYTVRSPLRSATHYIVNGSNLFQTILISSTFNPEFDNPKDIPNWEKDVNSLGYLGSIGFRVNTQSLYVKGGHRSFLNNSHLAFLYVPESIVDNNPVGAVRPYRSLSSYFDNENKLAKTPKTIPLPRTWDPFAAPKKVGSGLNSDLYFSCITNQITNRTVIAVPSIYNILFNVDGSYDIPDCMEQFNSPSFSVYNKLNLETHVFVLSEDWGQDNKVAGSLEIRIPNINLVKMLADNNSVVTANAVKEWTEISNSVAEDLLFYISRTISKNENFGKSYIESNPLLNYWSNMQELFAKSLSNNGIQPINSYKQKILNVVSHEYDEYAGLHQISSPLDFAKNKNILVSKVRNKLK